MKKVIVLLGLFFSCLAVMNAQSVVGKWKTIDDATGEVKSIVEITERGGKIYGKIIDISESKKRAAKCVNCSGADKDKPVLGLEIIKGLTKDGKEYNNGKILDPVSGKLYKCVISLEDANKLKVRGYVGMAAFGRTQMWQRVK